MTDRKTQQEIGDRLSKEPEEWTTGDEPMTASQRSYLHTVSEEAGTEVDDGLSKAEASQRIDELRTRTGKDSG